MGKVGNIEIYIRQCDENKDENEKEKLLMQIIHTYSDEISNITDGLDMYSYSFEGHKINYTEDAKLIKIQSIFCETFFRCFGIYNSHDRFYLFCTFICTFFKSGAGGFTCNLSILSPSISPYF